MPWLIEVYDDNYQSEGYLSEVDIEANGPNYPTGSADCTHDPAFALSFGSESEAWTFMFRRSQTCPLRPDGKPNRPLTALNYMIFFMEPEMMEAEHDHRNTH